MLSMFGLQTSPRQSSAEELQLGQMRLGPELGEGQPQLSESEQRHGQDGEAGSEQLEDFVLENDESQESASEEGQPLLEGAVDTKQSALPAPAKSQQQLKAMLRRQWLFKKRGWGQTLMEVASPLLMMCLFVLGWALTDVDHYEAQVYANTTVPLFEQLQDEFGSVDTFIKTCPAVAVLSQQISPGLLQQVATLLRGQNNSSVTSLGMLLQQLLPNQVEALNNALDALQQDLPASQRLDSSVLLKAARCADAAEHAKAALQLFVFYQGPVPVPSLDVYIGTHKLLQLAFSGGAGQNASQRIVAIEKKFGNVVGNLLHLGKLYFAPDTKEVAALVSHLKQRYQFFDEFYGGTCASEEAAVATAMTHLRDTWGVVVLNDVDLQERKMDFAIRMNFTVVPRTYRIVRKWHHGLGTHYKQYYTSGFLSLQTALNQYMHEDLTETKANSPYPRGPLWGAPFPIAKYSHNPFYDAVGPTMGLVMCLSTLYPLAMLVKALVEEKETKSKEIMRIMGLRLWIFMFSWFLTYLVVFAIVSLSVTLLVHFTFLPQSNILLVFLLMFLFTSSLIPFAFFLSVFFSSAKLAAIAAPFFHFASIMPRYIFFRSSSGQDIPGKSFAGLLPATAFTFGVDLLGQYEGVNMGLNWSSIAEDDFSLARILLLLCASFVLFSILTWYLEQVIHPQGHSQPPWFPFLPSYWRGFKSEKQHLYEGLPLDGLEEAQQDIEERLGKGVQAAVQIRGLRKVYPGAKVAVHRLDLDVYENEITGLLGHNGAGKSTTISMLTGLLRPTSGDAQILGQSIRTNMDSVRRVIGICPQQNVLFDKLTVTEHLRLYAAIKGLPSKEIAREISSMVTRLGLHDKLHAAASSLSGGMKRKLQVAIAMIGDSKVVFLDEPTSGMDPQSRRNMWELLRGFKTGRAIILTTHYMDEADLLCSRIAILANGRLRCCGTSLFLKARYGVGYNLTITRADTDCQEKRVQGLVLQHVPEARLLNSSGGEMAYQLPMAAKGRFAGLFEELESRSGELHIGAFGASVTTLEEVFLQLTGLYDAPKVALNVGGEARNLDRDKPLSDTCEAPSKGSFRSTAGSKLRGASSLEKVDADLEVGGAAISIPGILPEERSFKRAWIELFKKRLTIARRDVKGLLNSILLPVAVIAFVMLILTITVNPAGPSLKLDLELFKPKPKPYGPHLPNTTEVPYARIDGSRLTAMNSSYATFYEENVTDSIGMSLYLLESIHHPPRYGSYFDMACSHQIRIVCEPFAETFTLAGALIYNDSVFQQYNFSGLRSLNLTESTLLLRERLAQSNLTNITGAGNTLTDLSSFAWAPSPSPVQHTSLGMNKTQLNETRARARMWAESVTAAIQASPMLQTETGMGLTAALTVLHNTSSDHSFPAIIQELAQADLRVALANGSASLAVSNHPLPLTKSEATMIQTVLAALAALFILIPFCYLSATFAVFLVKERAVKAKHLQLVSGASLLAYWTATYAWDVLNYIVITSITMLVFVLYQDSAFVGTLSKSIAVLSLLTSFGLSVIPLSYCYSFGFSNYSSAQVAIAGLHFVSGFMSVVANLVMGAIEKTKALNKFLVHIYRVFPPFNLGEGLLGLSTMDIQSSFTGVTSSPFGWTIVGRPIFLMTLEAVFYLALTLAIDMDLPRKTMRVLLPKRTIIAVDEQVHEDKDVADERRNVLSGEADGSPVLIKALRKVHPGRTGPPKAAVQELYLSISAGECFGLLGVNGAGKTTTLSMLTGEIRPTAGESFVGGRSIITDLPGVQRLIGYCPQFDPLLDHMTGREHMEMYARLKGVPELDVERTVASVVDAVGLQKHIDRVIGTYSGGNKRKLSLGIALVGMTAVVFLDEPSSGMDPGARRSMWDIITAAAIGRGVCVVLTTHSMEECEALCSRVGLMAAGRLVCLGSVQHLKHRFGDGYCLELRQSAGRGDTAALHDFVSAAFPGALLEEGHSGRARYRLPREGLSLAHVFREVEAARGRLGVEDYSVSQSTLEQVFLALSAGNGGTGAGSSSTVHTNGDATMKL
eukprot:SM000176S03111  [mRNA]  locus=s176:35560:47252:+ [translate_table: standard]